jgi:hypothetical protein
MGVADGGIWERWYNLFFKPIEFDGFRKETGFNGERMNNRFDNRYVSSGAVAGRAGRRKASYVDNPVQAEGAARGSAALSSQPRSGLNGYAVRGGGSVFAPSCAALARGYPQGMPSGIRQGRRLRRAKPVEFDGFRKKTGVNGFVVMPETSVICAGEAGVLNRTLFGSVLQQMENKKMLH